MPSNQSSQIGRRSGVKRRHNIPQFVDMSGFAPLFSTFWA